MRNQLRQGIATGLLSIGLLCGGLTRESQGLSCTTNDLDPSCGNAILGATSDGATIGGGTNNTAAGTLTTIGGGISNLAGGTASTISGGNNNTTAADLATVGGGTNNTVGGAGVGGTVGGGAGNSATNSNATVGGGSSNDAGGANATVGGGLLNKANGENATVSGGSTNIAGGNGATVGGGLTNTASGVFTMVGGGLGNVGSGDLSAVGGGSTNTASGPLATVGGGLSNTASGPLATIGGGGGFNDDTNTSLGNTASGETSTIGGGQSNVAAGVAATIGGGQKNTANGALATVGGGRLNVATGSFATVTGGYGNTANGAMSWAGGRRARAQHNGTFVWADSTNAIFASTALNQYNVRASGGVRIFTNAAATVGVRLLPNDTGWDAVSSRDAKEEFQNIDKHAVLAKVEQLPITTWQLKGAEKKVRHLGPVAQDFHSAFQLGSDNQHINSVDADGVALVAIQALAERNAALEKQVTELQTQLRTLLEHVEQLKHTAP